MELHKSELAEALSLHQKWLTTGMKQGERFALKDLAFQDLNGVDLESADLEGANLAFADFHNANLEVANLQDANLYRANLRGAVDLDTCYTEGADFSGAIMN